MPARPIPKTEASLVEVFSSIQGEGILVGKRQIFVRFAQCNLNCAYCDTDFSLSESCRIEDAPGSGVFRNAENPVSLEVISSILSHWVHLLPGVHHSISLTGGEPLVQGNVLEEWLPVLREIAPLYLETNGTLPDKLAPVLPYLDWVSMDIKLASLTHVPTPWEAHEKFLSLMKTSKGQAKIVVGEMTLLEEIEQAATLVHKTAPGISLILQPVTVDGKITLSGRALLDMQTLASKCHEDVRVIPQTHRFLSVL